MRQLTVACLFIAAASLWQSASARERWTEQQASDWYAKEGWRIGSNYTPANAINQLEMWQADTFDPVTLDRELGWAEQLGMNSMRVFLHNLLWEQDAKGFTVRLNRFLEIAARHRIKPLFVLFDSVWDPDPKLGPQHPPIPGVHNSGWVQSPGRVRLEDAAQYPKLRAYVEGVVGKFAKDQRVLGWDLWNEPDNEGGGNYRPQKDKVLFVNMLLSQVYDWSLAQNPTQPVTSGVWQDDDWSRERLSRTEQIQINRSDVISFHDYNWPEVFERRVKLLKTYQRPVICTEFMARGAGSTFDGSLPIGRANDVSMFNWGFVDGRTQTRFPWDSWLRPYTQDQPIVWFHDVLHDDGTPYRQAEADLVKRLATQ